MSILKENLPVNLAEYRNNGYKHNYVCFLEDGRGDLEFEVFVTKRQAEKFIENNYASYCTMTFRQAAKYYPELFKFE